MPMCMWNEVKEFCSPSQMVFLSMDAPPSTVLHRCADKSCDLCPVPLQMSLVTHVR